FSGEFNYTLSSCCLFFIPQRSTRPNNQLIKLSNKQSWELPKDARQAQLFAINGNYLYYSDAISRVARLNLEDKTVKDVHVDFKPVAFFISDNNQIFFTESKYKDMQIIQISWND
ncbi:MAG: hypothetical protein V7683_16485, partial [Pseudoalteromonas distincta]